MSSLLVTAPPAFYTAYDVAAIWLAAIALLLDVVALVAIFIAYRQLKKAKNALREPLERVVAISQQVNERTTRIANIIVAPIIAWQSLRVRLRTTIDVLLADNLPRAHNDGEREALPAPRDEAHSA